MKNSFSSSICLLFFKSSNCKNCRFCSFVKLLLNSSYVLVSSADILSFSLFLGKRGRMNQIETIKNYILFLITERNLSVTLHPMESERVIGNSELMQFNIHDNPYCAAIKSSAEGTDRFRTSPQAKKYRWHLRVRNENRLCQRTCQNI